MNALALPQVQSVHSIVVLNSWKYFGSILNLMYIVTLGLHATKTFTRTCG